MDEIVSLPSPFDARMKATVVPDDETIDDQKIYCP
jgi:hypothetical protein